MLVMKLVPANVLLKQTFSPVQSPLLIKLITDWTDMKKCLGYLSSTLLAKF